MSFVSIGKIRHSINSCFFAVTFQRTIPKNATNSASASSSQRFSISIKARCTPLRRCPHHAFSILSESVSPSQIIEMIAIINPGTRNAFQDVDAHSCISRRDPHKRYAATIAYVASTKVSICDVTAVCLIPLISWTQTSNCSWKEKNSSCESTNKPNHRT